MVSMFNMRVTWIPSHDRGSSTW